MSILTTNERTPEAYRQGNSLASRDDGRRDIGSLMQNPGEMESF